MAGKWLECYSFQILSNCQLPSAAVDPVNPIPLPASMSSEGRIEEDGKEVSVELAGREFRSGALVRLYSTIRASLICHSRIEYYLLIL